MKKTDEDRLLFDVKVPNATTLKAIAELEAGKGKRFASVETLMADLHETTERAPLMLKVPNAETRAAMIEADEIVSARNARFATAAELLDDIEKTAASKRASLPGATDTWKLAARNMRNGFGK